MHYHGVGRSDCCLRQLISTDRKVMKQLSSCCNLALNACEIDFRLRWADLFTYCEWHDRDKLVADRIALSERQGRLAPHWRSGRDH